MFQVNLLLAIVAQQVDGLKSGEFAGPGSAAAALPAELCVRGRLLDGTSARPVVGAEVELWTESAGPPPVCVAHDTSRVDGSFHLARGGVQNADKVLIHAAGYRSTCVAASDTDEILLLPLAKHLSLRVSDLDGKPIVGARAETRQTCAHAPPAFVGLSNAAGVFDLSTFPPLDDEPEIFLSARGYGAELLQSPEFLLAQDGLEVRLPKRRPIAFHVVDTAGKALAHRRVALGEEPRWCASATDDKGRAVFDSPPCMSASSLSSEFGSESALLATGRIPTSFEPTFVLLPTPRAPLSEPSDAATRVPLHVVDGAGHALELGVSVLNERGSNLDAVHWLGKDWGRTTLVAGGPFTGWSETVRVLDAPIETTLQVTREPVLDIQLPADSYWIVHVQAGDDSITLDGPKFPLRQPVPAGKVIVVCAVGENETRLAHLGHIFDDCTLDLTRTSSVVPAIREQAPLSMHRWLVPGVEPKGRVHLEHGQPEWLSSKEALEFEAPANANFEGLVSAPERVPCAIGPWNATESSLQLARRTSLAVHGSLKAVYAGGVEGLPMQNGGFVVSDLAPGPLLVELVRLDGGVVSISLVLADGEQRELTLR